MTLLITGTNETISEWDEYDYDEEEFVSAESTLTVKGLEWVDWLQDFNFLEYFIMNSKLWYEAPEGWQPPESGWVSENVALRKRTDKECRMTFGSFSDGECYIQCFYI